MVLWTLSFNLTYSIFLSMHDSFNTSCLCRCFLFFSLSFHSLCDLVKRLESSRPGIKLQYSLGFFSSWGNRLVGLEVRASTSRAEDPGFESRLLWDFSGSSHTSDFKIVTQVATLPGAWRYRVSAGTGRPGVSIV